MDKLQHIREPFTEQVYLRGRAVGVESIGETIRSTSRSDHTAEWLLIYSSGYFEEKDNHLRMSSQCLFSLSTSSSDDGDSIPPPSPESLSNALCTATSNPLPAAPVTSASAILPPVNRNSPHIDENPRAFPTIVAPTPISMTSLHFFHNIRRLTERVERRTSARGMRREAHIPYSYKVARGLLLVDGHRDQTVALNLDGPAVRKIATRSHASSRPTDC